MSLGFYISSLAALTVFCNINLGVSSKFNWIMPLTVFVLTSCSAEEFRVKIMKHRESCYYRLVMENSCNNILNNKVFVLNITWKQSSK